MKVYYDINSFLYFPKILFLISVIIIPRYLFFLVFLQQPYHTMLFYTKKNILIFFGMKLRSNSRCQWISLLYLFISVLPLNRPTTFVDCLGPSLVVTFIVRVDIQIFKIVFFSLSLPLSYNIKRYHFLCLTDVLLDHVRGYHVFC